MTALLNLLIPLLIAGLIFWVIWWALDVIGIPEPFNKIARVIVVVAVVIYLISVLAGLRF